MEESLVKYIEDTILPMYDDFDAAHRRDHVDMVIEQSMEIARELDVNEDMVYAIAAYHDTGLVKDPQTHHLVSGEIIREDAWLKEWFNDEQIEVFLAWRMVKREFLGVVFGVLKGQHFEIYTYSAQNKF